MTQRFSLGRRAGLLLPLSSVRGASGDLGSYLDAGAVARYLVSAGCTLWQLLPLNEVSPGQDSPYAASSSYALEPVYIDLGAVEDLQGLTDAEKGTLDRARASERVDFAAYRSVKRSALGRAFARFKERGGVAKLARFREERHEWLEDWALYRALHDRRQKSWRDWEPGLRDREPKALESARAELRDAIEELCFVQWIADAQWHEGRRAANDQGVKVLGDLPFMVAEDSADVWSFQRFFRFDATVGVPPDAYSAEGQDWGLPVPRWDEMRAAGDPWLHLRADRAAELYDAFRVDHVVGLYRTYARPRSSMADKSEPFFVPKDPEKQKEQGERILGMFGQKAVVLAEDLGTVPDFVRASLKEIEVAGTKVLRWENDMGVPRDVSRFSPISCAVTGTHDTESVSDWWEGLADWEREHQLKQEKLSHLRGPDQKKFKPQTRRALLELAYSAGSDALLTPITDALGWKARMNTPGTVGEHNWTFRLPWTTEALLREEEPQRVARELLALAEKYDRKRT